MGKDADETDAEEIIDMANKASVADQEVQVQENVHCQIKTFCTFMDEILLPNEKIMNGSLESSQQANSLPRRSGLGFAVGMGAQPTSHSGEFLPCVFTFFFYCLLLFSNFFLIKIFLSINTIIFI